MRNASTSTAARGFQLFLAHEFKQVDEETLNEINASLARERREPVHMRSLQHYHILWMAGQETYIPINRWDVNRGSR